MKFERKGKHVFFMLTYLLVAVLHGNAQTNMVFYPMENQINSPSLNPAFLTSQSKFTFSIFPLSGMNVGYNNQRVIKDMLFKILKGDQTNDDFKDVFNSMVKLDLFYQRMENNIISIGYNSSVGSFDFRVRENMQLMTDLKGDFSDMVTNTSLQEFSPEQQQTFPAIALYYREYSIGYAKEVIKKKLTVGIRAKLYFGKSGMLSDVSGVEGANGANNIELSTSGQLNISTPLQIITDEIDVLREVELSEDFTVGNFLMNPDNMGVGFDVGFNYQPTRDLAFSASLTDVGSIKWNNNLNNMNFSGNGTILIDPVHSARIDDFSQLYKIGIDTLTYFTTQLPMTLYAGLKYRLAPKLKISIVNRLIRAQSMGFNSFSVIGVYDLKKNLSISSGYSVIGNSYGNFPFSILYTGDAGQYYIGTDSLLSMIVPKTSDFSGITFGMCFFLFRNRNIYKEHEYFPFYKEKKK